MRTSIDATLDAHAPVDAPTTWVLSNHDVTRPVTRYGRADTSFAFEAKRAGTPTDLDAAPAAPGRPRCSRWRCRARCTSTRARSSACPRSRTSRPTAARTRCGSAPAASIPAATAAASRSRGRDASRRSASAPTAPPTVARPARRLGRLTVEAAAATRRRCSRSIATGLRLRRAAPWAGDGDSRWLRSPDSVLAFARGERFVCLVNFGPDPVDLPAGADVLLASGELEGGASRGTRRSGCCRPSPARPDSVQRKGRTMKSMRMAAMRRPWRRPLAGRIVAHARPARCRRRLDGEDGDDQRRIADPGQRRPRRSSSSTHRSRSSRRRTRRSRSSRSSTSGRRRRSRPSSPPARCRRSSRCRSPTPARSATTASSPTSPPSVEVAAVLHASTTRPCSPRAPTRRARSSRCRRAPTRRRCTTTASSSRRRASTRTSRRRRGRRCRRYAKQIARRPARPATSEMAKDDNTAGWILTTLVYALGGRMETGQRHEREGDAEQHADGHRAEHAQADALDRQLDGLELRLRLERHQPGVRRGQRRHVHQWLGRLHEPRSGDEHRPVHLRAAPLPLAKSKKAGVLGGGTAVAVKPTRRRARRPRR